MDSRRSPHARIILGAFFLAVGLGLQACLWTPDWTSLGLVVGGIFILRGVQVLGGRW